EAQRNGGIFTGITGIQAQDQAVTESMGGITDHAFENLAPSDLMIARTRRRLLRAARALAKDGTTPPCVDEPGIYTQVRRGDFLVERDGLPRLEYCAITLRQRVVACPQRTDQHLGDGDRGHGKAQLSCRVRGK